MTQLVNARARFFTRDPTRVAGARGNLAVERNRQFQMNEWTTGLHEMNVRFVQLRSFTGHQTGANHDARFAQVSKAPARNLRIWIFSGRYHAPNSCFDQGLCAWRGAPLMSMRLERNVGSTAPRLFARQFEGQRLCMLNLIVNIKALTDDLSATVDDNRADQRPGTNVANASHSEFESATHHALIKIILNFGAWSQLVEKAAHVLLGIENNEVIKFLANPCIADRQPQFFRDRYRDAAVLWKNPYLQPHNWSLWNAQFLSYGAEKAVLTIAGLPSRAAIMYKIQVQDDDNDASVWHDVKGADGHALTFSDEGQARAKLEELYPVLVKMERYAGPKRTRVIKILTDED